MGAQKKLTESSAGTVQAPQIRHPVFMPFILLMIPAAEVSVELQSGQVIRVVYTEDTVQSNVYPCSHQPFGQHGHKNDPCLNFIFFCHVTQILCASSGKFVWTFAKNTTCFPCKMLAAQSSPLIDTNKNTFLDPDCYFLTLFFSYLSKGKQAEAKPCKIHK